MFEWLRKRKPQPARMPGVEVPATGWQAINNALARLYGDATPEHVSYTPPAAISNNLDGCSAYAAGDHWHYVTYGLSELFVRAVGADADVSGWGFEFTLRVPRVDGESAPAWPFEALNGLANHVNGNRLRFEAGHRINASAPITGYPDTEDAPDTGLTVWAIGVDPELGTIETPNGRVEFLQVVGVTDAENARMIATSTEEVLAELARTNPLLVTDPTRA